MSASLSFENHPYFAVAKEILAAHNYPAFDVRSCRVNGEVFVRIFVNRPIDEVVDLNFELADTLATFDRDPGEGWEDLALMFLTPP